jgi:hypothetical protein
MNTLHPFSGGLGAFNFTAPCSDGIRFAHREVSFFPAQGNEFDPSVRTPLLRAL